MILYREANNTDLAAITNLCAESFLEYPYFKTTFYNGFKNEHGYKKFMNDMLYVHIKAYMRKHICFVGEKNTQIVSVSLLKHPNLQGIGLIDYILCGGIKLLFQGNPANLIKFTNYMDVAHQACEDQKKDAWYLELLAVDRNCQGQNLGSRMIQECLKPFILKMKGVELSLITNTKLNCKFYEKNGFKIFDARQIGSKNNPIDNWSYCMQLR